MKTTTTREGLFRTKDGTVRVTRTNESNWLKVEVTDWSKGRATIHVPISEDDIPKRGYQLEALSGLLDLLAEAAS